MIASAPTRSRIGHFLALLVLLLAGLAAAARAQQGAQVDWSGTWDTRWRDSGARLILEQDGSTVTGTYPLFNGRIEAAASGRELRGRWMQEDRSGSFVFVQSRDGRTFAGRFESGEWWTGARSLSGRLDALPSDQSSPMATMRSFLTAANQAADGNLDALGAAAALLRLPDETDVQVARFELARALQAVIDLTTFRVWDLPHAAGEDTAEVTVVLEQAGTGQSVAIPFRLVEGRWFLAPPPIERLLTLAERMRAARAEGVAAITAGPGPQSPRAAMRDFLLSFRFAPDGSDPAAIAALDLRGRPEVTRAHDGQVLAGYLKRVIDRTGYVIWQEIPDDPASQVPYVHFEHPEGVVMIAPVETPEGRVWQFAPETLRTIRQVYAAIEDMPVAPGLKTLPEDDIHFSIRKALRGIAPEALAPLGPLERWQWAALAATLVLALVAARLAQGVATALMRAAATATGETLTRETRTDETRTGETGTGAPGSLGWALRGLAVGLVLFAATWLLGLPDRFTLVLAAVAIVLVVLAIFLIGWRLIGALAERYRKAERITGHNLILLSLVSGVLRAGLLIAAVLIIAHALSLPLTGVLAGFGIGGIAVALAAQPTLQNLLSGFTLYADRPISVGDFCRFGDNMGTVEHIGLRSTRLRTLDRTVISVPNSQFLDMELENFARRDRFFFNTVLQLRYETTAGQLRYVLVRLRELLIAHPKVLPEPLRVRFAGLGEHSLDIEIFSYVSAADINEFTAIREDILLRIMAAVAEAGTQFAFPSVVEYAARDVGPDPDLVRRAEATVESWRQQDNLPFPDFEWQTKAALSGSLDYPPDGSVLNRPEPA